MPWFNVDDNSTFHPKVIAAGNAAWGAFTRLGAYAAKHISDGAEGFVPDEIVKVVATKTELGRLITVGLVHKVDGGVQLHDYLDYNRDAQQVARDREKAADRQRRKRDRDRERDERDRHAVTSGVTPPVTAPVSHKPQDQDQEAVHLRDTPPPKHGPPRGGEIVDIRTQAIVAAYARLALEQARTAGRQVTSDMGYLAKASDTCRAMPELERWATQFPTAPADAIAAWLHGDKHSMSYYPQETA